MTIALSQYFKDPQVDVTISRFNSQVIFVLGEVNKPTKINITDIPLNLSDAIGSSFGLKTNTAGKDVFIIRQKDVDGEPKIFIQTLAAHHILLILVGFLMDDDIIYINSSSTADGIRLYLNFSHFPLLSIPLIILIGIKWKTEDFLFVLFA